jgi:hypothetical protein
MFSRTASGSLPEFERCSEAGAFAREARSKIPLRTDNENVVLEIECNQGIGGSDAMTFACGFIAVSLICAVGMAAATAI